MNIALILSGGIGNRLAADIPKQYIEVNGKTIISYCLDAFEACDGIDAIQIVANEEWQDAICKTQMNKLKGFSKPGVTRQLSILNGLDDIRKYAAEEDRVMIHDAARPLVTKELIQRVLDAVDEHDGSMPVLRMKDTVYYSEDGNTITSLLNRNCIYAGQAPECFLLGKYYQANKNLSEEQILKINGSTEPAILAGLDVAMVEGDEQNFKITTMEDLQRFKEMLMRE